MSEVTDHWQRPEIQPLFISPTPYLHSGRIRGGITQLPGDSTAVSGCWIWVKRAFILPILERLQCPRRTGETDYRRGIAGVVAFLAHLNSILSGYGESPRI
jgi:uncharacterized iron-regulated membrane protein